MRRIYKHVLVQNAATQGHIRHADDVLADPERGDMREEAIQATAGPNAPRRCT